jgi:hypothetical protein
VPDTPESRNQKQNCLDSPSCLPAYLFSVAQIADLPCRRLPIGRALAELKGSGHGAVLQDGILRYSRLAVCATITAEALNTCLPARQAGGRESEDKDQQRMRNICSVKQHAKR